MQRKTIFLMRRLAPLLALACLATGGRGVHAAQPSEPLPLSGPAGAAGPGSAPVADFALSASVLPPAQVPGHPVVAVVRFTCPPGWYVYADSVKVGLAGEGGAQVARAEGLRLPAPSSKYDEWLREHVDYYDGQFEARLRLRVLETAPPGEHALRLSVSYQGCRPDLCFPPRTRELAVTLEVLPPGAEPAAVEERGQAGGESATGLAGAGLLRAILLAYVGGLLLALTPCVYPLMPIVIGVIGATADRRLAAFLRSLLYVAGISVTYAVLGLVAASAGEAFGTALQSPVVYLVLAALLLALAASMFGLFTLQMPSSWSARLQAHVRGRWGLAGVFVLGLLSGVAVTACVAPVVSSALLYVFHSRNMLGGFFILSAIAWGMGTPLVVLGTFSGLLKALPRSGRWQEAVRYLLGAALVFGAGYFVFKSGLIPSGHELPGTWLTSEQAALELARAERKPVMLYFWQERCPNCDRLRASTFTDPRVQEEMRRFVCVAIDGTHWDAATRARMPRQYGVTGFPTIVFLGPGGRPLPGHTLVGYVDAERLLEAMRSVRRQLSGN